MKTLKLLSLSTLFFLFFGSLFANPTLFIGPTLEDAESNQGTVRLDIIVHNEATEYFGGITALSFGYSLNHSTFVGPNISLRGGTDTQTFYVTPGTISISVFAVHGGQYYQNSLNVLQGGTLELSWFGWDSCTSQGGEWYSNGYREGYWNPGEDIDAR